MKSLGFKRDYDIHKNRTNPAFKFDWEARMATEDSC